MLLHAYKFNPVAATLLQIDTSIQMSKIMIAHYGGDVLCNCRYFTMLLQQERISQVLYLPFKIAIAVVVLPSFRPKGYLNSEMHCHSCNRKKGKNFKH